MLIKCQCCNQDYDDGEPNFTLKDKEIAGLDIAGWRKQGGIRIIGSERVIKEWPRQLDLLGNTYELEEVKGGEGGYENAFYA